MIRSRRNDSEGGFSGDSFLDIVANLVGILVILVMVIGVQAKHAYDDAEAEAIETATAGALPPQELPDVASAASTVQDLKSQIRDQEIETKNLEKELAARSAERYRLQMQAELARRAINDRKGELDEQQQQQFDLNRQVNLLEQDLQKLLNEKELLAAEESDKPIELQHLPTPLAQTVFSQEEHFRLLDGRLTYVPLRQMVSRLKSEAPHQVWKLRDAAEVTEVIGPVQGFNLRYTLHRRKVSVPTSQGDVVRQIVELKEFTVIPVEEDLGVPLADALAGASTLKEQLAEWNADETIVTVWTYPDSFEEFRTLKNELFQAGFLTAARPLPAGHPITGSPNGSRSAAQ